MDEPSKLDYERRMPRVGHSTYGIASVCMAAAGIVFTALAGPPFYMSPFESMGNEKETRVAALAAILEILLATRALQDSNRKQFLAILGLVLNVLGFIAAWVLLPYI